MVDRRGNPWAFLAVGMLAALVLTFGWMIVSGGHATESALSAATEAAPDLRPQLPEPKLPDPPLPIPK